MTQALLASIVLFESGPSRLAHLPEMADVGRYRDDTSYTSFRFRNDTVGFVQFS
jgi:hypothetical protein